MKTFLSAILLFFVANILQAKTINYPCQNPPYYELSDALYANSPSKKMDFAQWIISQFLSLRTTKTDTKEQIKEEYETYAAEERVRVNVAYFNGVKTTILKPAVFRNNKKIVYFHGGAYRDEMLFFQWEMMIDLARKSGSTVYVVHYRLAPENTFPAPIEDGMAVYNKLLETFDASDLVFLGDSAGGGLALGLAGKIRDDGKPLPAQLILLSPWLDVATDNPDMVAYDEADVMLSINGIQNSGVDYVGPDHLEQLDNPYASPLLLEDLGDLPPCLMFIGTNEIFYPDAILFDEKAISQGMDITTVVVEGAFHVWVSAPAQLFPESFYARKQIASFINCGPEGERISEPEKITENLTFDLAITPNPSFGNLNISIDNKKEIVQNALVHIYDIKGINVYSTIQTVASGNSSMELSLALSKGIYFVNVIIDGIEKSRKLLVE